MKVNTLVAQLVEQAAHNRQVVGSSPTGSTLEKEKEKDIMTEEQMIVALIITGSCITSFLLGLCTGGVIWKKKKRVW